MKLGEEYEKVLELFDGRAVTILCYPLGQSKRAMGQLKPKQLAGSSSLGKITK